MNDIRDHLIIGVLGRDPELEHKQGQNGSYDEVSFSLAIERSFGDKTDWYNCHLTGKGANVINDHFRKGNTIYVFGHEESYKTDRDNMVHWIFKVSEFRFPKITQKDVDDYLSRKNASTNGNGTSMTSTEMSTKDTFEDIDEDVPF